MKVKDNKMSSGTYKVHLLWGLVILAMACNRNDERADAYGNFEVEETTISAEANGELLSFNVEEGTILEANQLVGIIDSTTLTVQKKEILANISAVEANRMSVAAQQTVLETEMVNAKRELTRAKVLLSSQSATQKQFDDLQGNVDVLKSQFEANKTQYAIINAQIRALRAKIALIEDQISHCRITNPTKGLVLTKLARHHELVGQGRALYKIADMSKIYLKAYISEPQLATIKQGQAVNVEIDYLTEKKQLAGTIIWVSSESEFTPKIIQTKEERVNLVYAIKVAVANDGYLKIGMPGEVRFQ